jgi:hypothetical protein
MPEPLNPRHLVPDASLNRARIVAMPGIRLPANIINQTGYDLVSSHAVFEQIRRHSAALGIAAELVAMPNPAVFMALDACFESEDGTIRAAAQQIGHDFGCNLGHLLLMLRRGDAASRAARPEWHDSYWAHWNTVETIWLGGGLIRGHLRDKLLDDVRAVFDAAATPAPQLVLDPYGAYLPLMGAARCGLPDYETTLVLDFGNTAVKRGLAVYERGTLIELDTLPEIPTLWHGDVNDKPALKAFFDFMTQTLVETFKRAAPRSPLIPVSIAAYLTPEGRPLDRQGAVYAALNQLGMNLQAQLSSAVRHTVGRNLEIKLIHDGTAAATVHPGDAVITLGTAIGVGLGAAVDQPLAIADDFHMID